MNNLFKLCEIYEQFIYGIRNELFVVLNNEGG